MAFGGPLLGPGGAHRRGVDLEDADELAIAVRDGLLDATSADRAVRRAVRAVDGLAAHGYDLHRWLTTHGMELTWQRR